MQAQRLIFKNHGKPSEVLETEDLTAPEPSVGQVLLEILAAPINPADLNYIEGTYGIKPILPATSGMECSAVVVQSDSPYFAQGDIVMPIDKVGSWSTYAIADAARLIALPKEIDPLQAAMLKVNPATAWLLLHKFASLNEGDIVTLNAANSAVGQCVIQLAASLGVRTVCFLRNEDLFDDLSTLGATHVFSDSPEGYAAAKETLGKEKARLAFNAVGGDSALRLMKLLEEGGTHITYGAMGRKPLTVPNGPLIFGDIRIRGLWVTKWMENAPKSEISDVYTQLGEKIASGTLKQEVDSVYPLSDYRVALDRLEAPDRIGKVLFSSKIRQITSRLSDFKLFKIFHPR